MGPSPGKARLARLRVLRNPGTRDLTLSAALATERRDLARVHRAVGGAAAAWMAVAPGDLRARCEVVRVSRGVLTVRAPDDATRFAADRWLRSGGLALIAKRTPTTITRHRLVR